MKKFPGRRALRNHPIATLEAALMADGVAPDKLYPLDVDRAFKKLEEIKPNITVWWTSGAQSAQLLNDGEVDMVMAWNGRVSALTKEGAKVAYTYNQGILQSTSLCILKGAPNLATAVKFLNEAVDPGPSGQSAAAHRLRPGEPEGVRYRRGQAGARRAAAERARQRQEAGADVLCLVGVAGRRSRREALGLVRAEIGEIIRSGVRPAHPAPAIRP